LKIRKASAEDMEAVYGLLCKLEEAAALVEDFREIYSGNPGVSSVFYFVCEKKDAVIALASLHIQRLLHHCARVARIQEIVVKSGIRGAA
jgi:PhnO protein